MVEEQKPAGEMNVVRPLRVWPAAILLVAMLVVRFAASLMPDPPDSLAVATIMGPLVASLLLVLWWLFFSRALWRERFVGLLAFLAIAAASTVLSDSSMRGFGSIKFAIPTGVAAFTVGLILTRSARPMVRTPIALIAAVLGFGIWTMARTDGMWGDFHADLYWRWTPTPETLFLASRKTDEDDAEKPVIKELPESQWPGFRGSDRNGIVPDVALLTDWNANKPQEKWRIRVGPGWSSFAVAGDLLFTQEQRDKLEAVVCYDGNSGKQLWAHEYESRFEEALGGPGPRATPTLHNGKLYALGATGLLFCLDPLTGDVVWKSSLTEDADRKPPHWGFASSPLTMDNTVIVHAGGKDDKGVLAYDATDGKLLWSAPAGDHSYSSVQLNQIDGRQLAVMVTNTGLSVLDPQTGKQLLDHEAPQNGYRVLQPLSVDGSSLLLAAQNGTSRLRIQNSDGSLSAEEMWTSRGMKPDFSDYVEFQGHLYGIDGKVLACIDLENGEQQWKKGRYGKGQLLLLPKEKQLLIAGEYGNVVLVAANPEKHLELARIKVFEGKTWNHLPTTGQRGSTKRWELPPPRTRSPSSTAPPEVASKWELCWQCYGQ